MTRPSSRLPRVLLAIATAALALLPGAASAEAPCHAYSFGAEGANAGILAPGDSTFVGFGGTTGRNFLLQVSVQVVVGDLGPNGGFTTWEFQDDDGHTWWWGWVKNDWSNLLVGPNSPSYYTCFVLTNRSTDLVAYEYALVEI